MTWAVDHPQRRRWRRTESILPTGVRATVRPIGASGVGLLSALAAAWGGISVFCGPTFGWHPTTSTAWSWTTQNWLLHLIPGAVGLFAALMVIALTPRRRAGAATGLELPALLLIASGIWFVIGPALWSTFESGTPFTTGMSPAMSFWNQLGSSLGPGLLLCIFGGMVLKASIARPAVSVAQVDEGAATTTMSSTEPVAPSTGVMAPRTAAEPARGMAGEPTTVNEETPPVNP